ncbi:DUF6090 family protein [Algoriphagus namhaensis]|uniref:DUF6090 family protein n=1 Tax=Algoriphagus namhaensis TaxID=915353 RepID=A0ABV8AS65_9BACT
MIKFFRKIRQDLLSTGKTGKYFKYAIGEIVLVVIGILIALQINNWNESNQKSKKQIELLTSLRNEINADIIYMSRQDSIYSIVENKFKIGINLFYKARNIKDIDSVNQFTPQLWNDFSINKNTYNEMLNSGDMYQIKNKPLQENIVKYYLNAEEYRYYFREITKELSHLFVKTPDIYPYKFLVSQINNPKINMASIDTTWINNPSSPTYQAIVVFFERNQEYNIEYRKKVYKRMMSDADSLVNEIYKELGNMNK